MSVQHEHALLEVQLQVELDEQRGVPPLAPRARALQEARASGDQQAQRQALIDLAAVCIAMAGRIPAPINALDELKLRTTAHGYHVQPRNARGAVRLRCSRERRHVVEGRGAPVLARPNPEPTTPRLDSGGV